MAFQIDTTKYFQIGSVIFIIIGICQLINLFTFAHTMTIWSIIVSAGYALFSFVTSGFFMYLLKSTKSQIRQEELSSYEEIKKAIE